MLRYVSQVTIRVSTCWYPRYLYYVCTIQGQNDRRGRTSTSGEEDVFVGIDMNWKDNSWKWTRMDETGRILFTYWINLKEHNTVLDWSIHCHWCQPAVAELDGRLHLSKDLLTHSQVKWVHQEMDKTRFKLKSDVIWSVMHVDARCDREVLQKKPEALQPSQDCRQRFVPQPLANSPK